MKTLAFLLKIKEGNAINLQALILGDPGADIGGEGKSKRGRKKSAKKGLQFFSSPFRLSLAPTIAPGSPRMTGAQIISHYFRYLQIH